jgi:hypothetical protein
LVFWDRASKPEATLSSPVVLAISALDPVATFSTPVVLRASALDPVATL